ncbi:MAG: RDD family protein [Candidatus Korobacteraceae bacterium]
METVLDEVCASCGNTRLPDGKFCLFCGDLLSDGSEQARFPQSELLPNSAPLKPETTEYAGFWLRFWAGAVDVCLESVGALILTLAIDFLLRRFGRFLGISSFLSKVATGVAFILVLAVGSWLYCAFMESSSWRATVGKRLLGLQVVTSDGDRISFGTATVRHLMKFLSFFCLTIGFMMSGWTKRRQALHDIPCDCLVIRTPQKGFSLLNC